MFSADFAEAGSSTSVPPRPSSLPPDVTNPREEAQLGIIKMKMISNHNGITKENMMLMLEAKSLISNQLFRMPETYVIRTVFDPTHRTLTLLKNKRVFGASTFRVFAGQGFTELVFMVVDTVQQIKGYGSHIMNHLKAYHVQNNILFILTYADNHAIGYFKKQGFQKKITIGKQQYDGFIKGYVGATLMECKLNPLIDYLNQSNILAEQRRIQQERAQILKQFPALHNYHESFADHDLWSTSDEKLDDLTRMCRSIIAKLRAHSKAWPFEDPVDPIIAPDYYSVIKDPIDLSKISRNLKKRRYKTSEMFTADVKRIFSNCRIYNKKETVYFKCAAIIEEYFEKIYDTAVKNFVGTSPP